MDQEQLVQIKENRNRPMKQSSVNVRKPQQRQVPTKKQMKLVRPKTTSNPKPKERHPLTR